jgi:CRISPR-associated protein Cmx8
MRRSSVAAESLELGYVLHDLPSAQHKAGLAGLVVVLKSLQARRARSLPEILHVSPGQLVIRASQASLQAVFDDLYDATTEEVQVAKKWAGQAPRREVLVTQRDPDTGKTQQARQYVYERDVPKAEFLRAFGMPPVWLRLWRDAVWSTVRGIPKTRLPYEQRRDRKPVTVAADTWTDLMRWRSRTQDGRGYSTDLAGTPFVGAQARTAESVPFRVDASHKLLLHFWPVVMTCWVPEVLRPARTRREVRTDREPVGYVLAVPEVADLEGFVETFPGIVAELSPESAGFRPRQALISLPEEGALEFLREVSRIARARAGREETASSVHGVEVYHLQKRGNTIPVLHASRVPMDRGTLERYELVRELRHPLLKAQLIRNVLQNRPWHEGFGGVFTVNPQEVFFRRDFVRDVTRRFTQSGRMPSGR